MKPHRALPPTAKPGEVVSNAAPIQQLSSPSSVSTSASSSDVETLLNLIRPPEGALERGLDKLREAM